MELAGTGTADLVDTVAQDIVTITDPGVYVFVWDRNYLQAGDDLTVTISNKILAAGAKEVMYYETVNGTDLGGNNKPWSQQSDPILVNHEATVTALASGIAVNLAMAWRLVKLSGGGVVEEGTQTIANTATATAIESAAVSGIYVLQLDLGLSYGAGHLDIWVDCPDPAGGMPYIGVITAPATGTTFWQSDPFVVLDTITFNIKNDGTGASIDVAWALTRVG